MRRGQECEAERESGQRGKEKKDQIKSREKTIEKIAGRGFNEGKETDQTKTHVPNCV